MPKVRGQQIYPAASPLGVSVPSPEVVSEHLETCEESERGALYFLLGNLLLDDEQHAGALLAYRRAIDLGVSHALTNLGVALKLSGRFEEAKKQFERGCFAEPQETLPLLHLADVHVAMGEKESATTTFKKVLEMNPEQVEALLGLGALLDEQGQNKEALELYRQAFSLDSDAEIARNRLGREHFQEGKLKLEAGDWEAAFVHWAEGEKCYPGSFQGDQQIVREMKELLRIAEPEVTRLVDELRPALVKKAVDAEGYHHLFSRYFFSLGLQPLLHENPKLLAETLETWQGSLERLGEHPYARFRCAVALCYQGELEKAIEELLICEDNLPRGKRKSLKVSDILTFVKMLYRLQMTAEGVEAGSQPVEEWNSAGFNDPFQIRAWSRTGITAEESANWKRASFTPDQAREWRALKLSPAQARQWVAQGFSPSRQLAAWTLAKIGPETAKEWTGVFAHESSVAIQCLSVGIEDPHEANSWLEHFQFPAEAASWRDVGFQPEGAAAWLEKGVKEPFSAKRQQELLETVTDTDALKLSESEEDNESSS